MKSVLGRKSRFGPAFVMLLIVIGLPAMSWADVIYVDGYIRQEDTNWATMSADINMEYNSATNLLTITLKNTSGAQPAGAAGVLTGIGFSLPGTLYVASGQVLSALGDDISSRWGYANGTTGSSAFYSKPIDTNIRTVTDGQLSMFSGTGGVQGPNYGVLATGGNGGGLDGLSVDFVTIKLMLGGDEQGQDVLKYINDNYVVAGFGSPTALPEAGTFLLLGTGLVSLVVWRRKKRFE